MQVEISGQTKIRNLTLDILSYYLDILTFNIRIPNTSEFMSEHSKF